MKETLKQFIIMLVSIIVMSLASIRGVIYTLIKHLWKLDYKIEKQLAPIFRSIALAFDGIANACSGEYYNDRNLIVKGKYPYGRWQQTLSAVTGYNVISKNLTCKGKKFRKWVDDIFSFFGEKGSHVLNAIKSDIMYK